MILLPPTDLMKLITAVLLLSSPLSMAADTRFAGRVGNTKGEPVAQLTIHFYRRLETGFEHRTAATGADGRWQIDLPEGDWRGAAHSDELLSRGYFCFPGFVWCGDNNELCEDQWPPLWGGGLVEWNPVITPGQIFLTVVPTRPELSVEKPRTPESGVRVSFESAAVSMRTIRQWRIEKSIDLQTWTPLRTVALSGDSPVMVPDSAGGGTPVCYYRAVQVEDFVPSPTGGPDGR